MLCCGREMPAEYDIRAIRKELAMAQKFPFSIWNYNLCGDFKPDEVDVWAECGLSVVLTERVTYGKDDPRALIPFLDRAREKGIKLIANIDGLTNGDIDSIGDEEYERRFVEVYNLYKGNEALYGFYIGDEPSSKKDYDASARCIRIQKRIAPELRPYINFQGYSCFHDPSCFDGRTFGEWLHDLNAETGFSNFSFSQYEQVSGKAGVSTPLDSGDMGIEFYYRALKPLIETAEAANVDVWGSILLSAHYHFRVPSEYDIMWQITTSAACGCRGMIGFRFYDRTMGPNYHGSPVDEYGNKTEQFYKLLRCQRRFADHYGELLMSLRRQSTYFLGKQRGAYPIFGLGSHPIITEIRANEEALVSFFKAEDGTEYLCLVNGSQVNDGVYKIFWDKENYDLVEVLCNGTHEMPYSLGNTDAHWDGQWLYPGQMCMFRITKK